MPIRDPNDAREVHGSFDRIFDTALANRANVVRRLFVEVLDFERHTGTVSLRGAPKNVKRPASAEFVARLDGFYVLYMHLSGVETNRVRRAEVQAAARLIEAAIGEDILLVVSNQSGSQLHIILPDFSGSQSIILRRMVVTKGVPRRTVVQQIANIYVEYRTTGNLRKTLSDAFDVEEVTRDFFEKYKEIFDRALLAITGFGNDEESKRRFTQTLFNRLMFVHFLSRKARTGWLSINGDTDYLRALWDDFRLKAKPLPSGNMPTFYDERLKLLFFTGLNNPESRNLEDGTSPLIGTAPFLNGGLFEEGMLDKRDGVFVPDSVIEAALTELFERFNFTVMESTPFDIEVAVDPEMLGKIFEELVNKRHDSGAYYTPRPVVAFMCREALKGYLEGKDTGVGADAIARFVDSRETDGIGVDAARRIAHALDEITVVDPACGSGAFLLGMMQELVELQTTLYNVGVDPESLYDLKLHIIERNLYGVDIDDFAVNIAMLRLWLSLAIDFDGAKLEPLPNLDFKIVTGDSLLGPDPSPENYGTLFRHQVIGVADKLATLKGEYMKAYDPSYKNEFREGIGRLEQELTQALAEDVTPPPPPPTKIVDWRVQFAEVFARNGGFDVAIANPPYVQLQRNQGKLASQYEGHGYATFARTGDIYYLFYEQAFNLLRDGGHLCFISSNQWMRVDSGKALRRFLENQNPIRLVNFGEGVFENVTVNTCVLIATRAPNRNALEAADVRQSEQRFPPSTWMGITPTYGETWAILSAIEQQVKAKIEAQGTRLREWEVDINRTIVTGYDKAFIINTQTRDALIAQDPESAEIIKPVLKGQDIQRWQVEWADRWLLFVPWHFPLQDNPSMSGNSAEAEAAFHIQYPAAYQYLEQHRTRLEARNRAETGIRYEWYALQRWAANYYQEFSKAKIAWGNLNKQAKFAHVPEGVFLTAPATILTPYSPYLLAALNSRLLDWYFMQIGVQRDAGYYEYKPMFIERLPVPIIASGDQQPFAKLVDQILAAKDADSDADVSELESQIDALVYDLYGLTEDEIAVVGER